MKKLVIIVLFLVLAGCSGNVSESRGEPHRGQVSNGVYSAGNVRVYPVKGKSYVLKPGEASIKGQRIRKLCISEDYTASLVRQSDENPLGFPQEPLSSGACAKVNSDDTIGVTVKK